MPHRLSPLLIPTLRLFLALLVPGAGVIAAEPPVYDHEAEATYKQLTWDDFKGRWRKLSRFGAEGAYVGTGLKITDWHATPERLPDGAWRARPEGLVAYSFVEKFQSSVRPGNESEYALAHEQGHFDLTESVARELSAGLKGVEGRGPTARAAAQDLKHEVDTAFAAALQRLDEIQSRYDRETRHGTRKKAQKKWLREIERRLAATEDPPP